MDSVGVKEWGNPMGIISQKRCKVFKKKSTENIMDTFGVEPYEVSNKREKEKGGTGSRARSWCLRLGKMEFELDGSLKEWAKDKPLSILQLDPADRAVLRIAGEFHGRSKVNQSAKP
ncbi:hypothetical protein M0802_004489 [Mischocyttarus mexicanus]|nr:hypothetical protein M0802_004489 [Mischocyttarus mexicanus]